MSHEFTGKPLETAFDKMLDGNLTEAALMFEEKLKDHNYEKAKEYFKMVMKLDQENKNAEFMLDYLIDI